MAESGANSFSTNMNNAEELVNPVLSDKTCEFKLELHVTIDGQVLCDIGEPTPSPLRIAVTDHSGPYICHHFTECDNKSSDVVKNTRGVISREGNVVCRTFKFVPEYIEKSQEAIDALKSVDWSDVIVYPAHEGTNLRLWHDQGQWHISSFKKIDAFRSKWGCSTSHGQMFFDAIEYMLKNERFMFAPTFQTAWDELNKESNPPDQKACFDFYCSLLSPNTIYTFVVLTTIRNRIVCKPGSHSQPLYFTGEFSKSDWILLRDNTSGICPPEIEIEYDVENMAESFISFVEKLDPYQWQGLMIHYKVGTSSFGSIKLTSSAYQALSAVRGNTPSVPFRYLQLREWPNQAKMLVDLYPEHVEKFNDYELILNNLAEEILAGYILRYIKKQFIMLPQELFFIARDLNNQWQLDHKRVTKQAVVNKINSLSSIRLNYLIKAAKERAVEELQNELALCRRPRLQRSEKR